MGVEHLPGKRFTADEVARIREWGERGASAYAIAKRLGRAHSSVRVKLMDMAVLDEIEESGGTMRRVGGWKPVWIEPEES